MPSRLTLQSFRTGHPVLTTAAHREFRQRLQTIGHLQSRITQAEMDVRTVTPKKGKAAAGDEIATLQAQKHSLFVDPRLRDLALQVQSENAGTGDPFAARNVQLYLDRYEDLAAVSADLEARSSRARSMGKQKLEVARAGNDFGLAQAALTEIFAAIREKAQAIKVQRGGFYADLYDTRLPFFQTGITGAQISGIFAPLRAALTTLIPEVMAHQARLGIDGSMIAGECDIDAQMKLALELQTRQGVDFEAGWVRYTKDGSCSEIVNPRDVRSLLKLLPGNFLTSGLRTILHEGGHTRNFQGLDPTLDGREWEICYEPIGGQPSFAVSEAIAMLYDRELRLHPGFFRWIYPKVQAAFPAVFAPVDLATAYRNMHVVKPGFIRTQADDLTYHLHIMLRTGMEMDLVNGRLEVKDLRERWNSDFKAGLGIDVPDDLRGVLSDIHWFEDWIGYFPFYTLGRIYARQIFRAFVADAGDPTQMFERGDIQSYSDWLQRNLYRHAARLDAADLMRELTGVDADADGLVSALRQHYMGDYPI